VSLPGEDFVGLVQDLLALNPEVKLDLGNGWFRGMVDRSPSRDEQRRSDDPIGDLRRSYTKNLQRERIGRVVAVLSEDQRQSKPSATSQLTAAAFFGCNFAGSTTYTPASSRVSFHFSNAIRFPSGDQRTSLSIQSPLSTATV
jgi:hypothetical protein